MKKILVVVGAVLICVALGLLIPRFMNDGTKGMQVDMEALQKNFEVELQAQLEVQMKEQALKEQLEKEYDEMLIAQRQEEKESANMDTGPDVDENSNLEKESEASSDDTEVEVNETDVESVTQTEEDQSDYQGAQESEDNEEDSMNDPDTSDPDISDEDPTKDTATTETETLVLSEEEQVVKDKWVQEQINANRDAINDDDLYTGAAIYNQLDTSYLFALAEDGLTEEERQEVEDYLRATLSPDQLEIAYNLYTKYIHLVD